MSSEEQVKTLLNLAKTGSEADVRAFINEHWAEFPEDIQDHIAMALMTDAAQASAAKLASEEATPTAE